MGWWFPVVDCWLFVVWLVVVLVVVVVVAGLLLFFFACGPPCANWCLLLFFLAIPAPKREKLVAGKKFC